MKELLAILASLNLILDNGKRAILATVVDVRGSSYRLPGAKMLVLETGETFGTISGGCLEADVLERAKQVLQNGEPQIFVYDTTKTDDSIFSLNMGCRGVIRILLEPANGNKIFDFLQNCVESRKGGVIATLIAGENKIGTRLFADENGTVSSDFSAKSNERILPFAHQVLAENKSRFETFDFGEIFFEFIVPPLNLIVFGAGADVLPLVEQSKHLGWRVTVVDHRTAIANKNRFPNADEIIISRAENLKLEIDANSAAVVMTHNYEHDKLILSFLLKSTARYIGALGPKRRTENILRELSESGETFAANQLQHLFAPVGLDIGADTPETIALSIIAEIQSVLSNRAGGFLRNRQGSIYNRV